MSTNPFYRLAPFIQDYIYRNKWTELRDLQVEACRIVFDSDNHLILAAGTASGKTEAAFLPILTELHTNPSKSVGAMYIGPTKALINDQFLRLNDLLLEAEMPVYAWHGDISPGQKKRLRNKPKGVLQITPESIESILINYPRDIPRIFGDLRFIVIDEVHVFMNSERGQQVLCQLARLAYMAKCNPRRVGLSATLGGYEAAEEWLEAKTGRGVTTVTTTKSSQIRLAVEHFYVGSAQSIGPHEQYIFDTVHEKNKVLIFANNRSQAEDVIGILRRMAQRLEMPDIYHVHHGSISTTLRQAAEESMKDEDQRAITAATLTLELGIDIGHLERVLQLGSPYSVASFLQRLGRSGRRGGASEMWFVNTEDVPSGHQIFAQQIPWDLLQTIAIIQLYAEERWVEPITNDRYPFNLLYHQTMSTLTAMGELDPSDLARLVLTLPPFEHISFEEYRTLLHHLMENDHIERVDHGGLIVGLAGERIVRNFRFFPVFQSNEEYVVRSAEGEVGRIMTVPSVGDRLGLAGKTWQVVDIDARQRIIWTHAVQGKAKGMWSGGNAKTHNRILQQMHKVLSEDTLYPYLQPNARQRLQDARWLANNHGMTTKGIVPMGGKTYALFPWLGNAAFEALVVSLSHDDTLPFYISAQKSPFYLVLRGAASEEIIRMRLQLLAQREPDLKDDEVANRHKFDEHLPRTLVKKSYIHDYLDFEGMREGLREI
ncbi:MAG: DEAD/DEAH box helicase [Chloroflexota bacterium]